MTEAKQLSSEELSNIAATFSEVDPNANPWFPTVRDLLAHIAWLESQRADKEPTPLDLIDRTKVIDWLARRCDYAPVCGRCTYCAVALNVKAMPVATPPPDAVAEEGDKWRSEKAQSAINDAAELIANCYCGEDDTFHPEVQRLVAGIARLVDKQ